MSLRARRKFKVDLEKPETGVHLEITEEDSKNICTDGKVVISLKLPKMSKL
jgi:hypothetical protein